MATIVTQYDPWREKLAAGLGVNLLSDAIQRSQAADAQRKNNAVYAETLKSLGLMGDEQEQSPYDPLLSSQVTPEGYNNNGWAKTMHDSYTPMTQFNLGTSGITQPASTNKNLGQLDYITALAKTINSDPKRFGGVDFSNIYTNMLKPTMEADAADYATQLAAQQRKRQQDTADLLLQAPSRDVYGRVLNAYLASGDAPKDAANAMQEIYEYLFPNFKEQLIDTGGALYPMAFAPDSGRYISTTDKKGNPLMFTKTPTPDKILETNFNYANMGRLEREHADEMQLEALKYGQSGQDSFREYQKQIDEQLAKDEESLLGEITRIMQDAEAATDPKEKAAHEAKLAPLRASLERTRQIRQAIRNSLIAMYHGGQQGGQGKSAVNSRVRGYSDLINKYAQEFGVDPDLITAIMQVESAGNPNAVSKEGARGLMQFMSDTASNIARNLGIKEYDLHDPETSIKFGAALLKELQTRYKGNLEGILGDYNGGPRGANPKTRAAETQKYIPNVLSILNVLKAERQAAQQQQTPQVVPLTNNQPTSQTGQQTQTPQGEGQKTTQQQSATQFDNTRPVLVNDKGETLTEAKLVVMGDGDISKGIQLAVQKGFRGYKDNKDNSAGHGLAYNPLYEFGGTPTGASIGDYIQAIPEAIMRGIESIGNSSAYQSIANLGNDKTALQFDFPNFSNIIGPISQAFSNWRDIERNPQQRGREPSQVPEQVSAQVPISTQTPAQNTTPATAPQFEISDINRFTQYGDNPAWGNFIPNAVDNFAELLTENPSTNPLYEFTSENTFTPPSAIEADYSDLINTIRQTASNWSGINRTPQRRGSEIKEPQEDSTQYVDISQKPETWQDPDALLRRSYMQTGGEQSLLDKLNGDNDPIRFIWDGIPSTGAPLWDPPQRTGKPEVTFEGPIGQFHRLNTPWGAGISDDKRPSMGMQSAPMTVEQLIGLQSDPLALSAWSNPMPYDPLYMGNNSDDINAFREFMDALTLSRWINSGNAINGFYSRFRGR